MTTLLYSGNFGLGHELGTILRAVQSLNGDTNLRVLLVGDGKGLAETRQLVNALGLAHIEFRPPVPLYDLPDLLASGDFHLVSQKPGTEGLLVPSKIYGSLAAGRPVIFIGPEHCEVARIVRDSRCGFVIAPGDVESAAQVLRQLALDAELRTTMGQRARQYYAEKFGRKRSVAQIVDVIEQAAAIDDRSVARLDGRQSCYHGGIVGVSHRYAALRSVTTDKRNYGSAMAALLTVSTLMLISGLTYRALAARLGAPLSTTPIASGALESIPRQIGAWTGQDVPLDQAVVRKTGTDAYINRRYSRNESAESIMLYVACGINTCELVAHYPEKCYGAAGWMLASRRVVELPLKHGRGLPCTVLEFSRKGLSTEKVIVLHYCVVGRQFRRDISYLRSKLWRVFDVVDHVAQVQIVADCETRSADSATKIVRDFAVASAFPIAEVFGEIEKTRRDLRDVPKEE